MDRIVGNIYYGRVEAVLPGMQAAFVDIGLEKSGFLHASDLIEPEEVEFDEEDNGNNRRPSRRAPSIQDHLSRGQAILVQVTKEPISTKGCRVTAQISIPGRFLVYLPSASRIGVSRKIESREKRARLRKINLHGAYIKCTDEAGVAKQCGNPDLTFCVDAADNSHRLLFNKA